MRGGRRGGCPDRRYRRIDEHWIPRLPQAGRHQHSFPDDSNGASTSQAQSHGESFTPMPPSSSRTSKPPASLSNRTQTTRSNGNRRAQGARVSWAKKTEAGCANSAGGQIEAVFEGDNNPPNSNSNVMKEERGERSESTDEVNDAARRLEELRFRVEEPDLTEEQLSFNDQLQEDELLAMESIYGENAVILNRQKGLRIIQIYIHIEAPDQLAISARLTSDHLQNLQNGRSDEFPYTFKVQYLPPIVLTCSLPESYPSHLPPHFTISVQWLDTARISSLCCMLDSLWLGQSGHEVIYMWVEWLHGSSLSFLQFGREILLGPYSRGEVGDRRAVSKSISPEFDIPLLISYNENKCFAAFCKSLHVCEICFSEFTGTEFVMLQCRHFFCQKCMRIYSDIHVKEGTVTKLRCPNPKCKGMLPPNLLKRLLGDDGFERWEALMLQKTLDSMGDVSYCPRCETACIGDDDQHAQCSKCYFSFCTLCRERRHVGVACMTPELKLRILKERQNSSLLKDERKRRELDMINEILSVKEMLRDAKQCPSCRMAISRTEGCNKMVCSNCGQFFCYCCNNAISGYEHFSDGQCQLFPQVELDRWEVRINERQMLGQVQAQLHHDHGLQCPNCRQFNAKVSNNNHMFCFSCQMHYCYLCKQIVRRSSHHFGPKGCKQHTLD